MLLKAYSGVHRMSDKTEVLGTMMTDTPWRKYVSR